MRLLADFVVESDLCLPKDSAPVEVHDRTQSWVLTLSNIDVMSFATVQRPGEFPLREELRRKAR